MQDIITLVGPRSVGKSTVGRIMAESLGREFIDLDSYMNRVLESEGGIPGYTEKFGWKNYMDRLHKELKYLLTAFAEKRRKVVLDCGGGTLSSEYPASILNAHLLQRYTKIVLLLPNEDDETNIRILFERERQRDHFRGWTEEKLMEKVREDYFNRVPGMKKFAHQIIHIQKRTPNQLSDYLMTILKND